MGEGIGRQITPFLRGVMRKKLHTALLEGFEKYNARIRVTVRRHGAQRKCGGIRDASLAVGLEPFAKKGHRVSTFRLIGQAIGPVFFTVVV